MVVKTGKELEPLRLFSGFLSLLGSGVATAIGFILFTSGRIPGVTPDLAVFLVLFVQWQTLGLTVVKMGIEQLVFVSISEDRSIYVDTRPIFLKKVLPLAVLFGIITAVVFSSIAGAVVTVSLVLDTISLTLASDLNARQHFQVAAIGNLLNYPMFFLLTTVMIFSGYSGRGMLLGIFLLSSVSRWLWFHRFTSFRKTFRPVRLNVHFKMGIQQGTNYLLFRSDQVLLSLVLFQGGLGESTPLFVFLAKFPELVSGVLVIAGSVLFPKYYIKYPLEFHYILRRSKNWLFCSLAYCFVLTIGMVVYTRIWKGVMFSPSLAIPFCVHAILMLVTNSITYSMLRHGYINGLLRNLFAGLVAGSIFLIAVKIPPSFSSFSWLIPVQLSTFLIFGFFASWGKKEKIHVF